MAELDDLKGFVEVVETGGFGRAAKRLGVSKSIISRRIARLEAELGTRLLSRTTRGVSPTEAGLEFKTRSQRILADLDEARDAVAQQGSGVIGRLRLSLPLSFGLRHVTPVLGELAKRHPRLEITAEYSDRFVDLIGERFDAAVRLGLLKDSSLVARRIAPIYGAAVASPAYLAERGRPETPQDLGKHECLIYTGTSVAEWSFRVGKRWTAVRPAGRLRSDSGEALMQWATDGLGIAVLPTFIISDAVESGRLEPLLTDFAMPEAGLFLVRPPGAQVSGKLRVLIDALVERFGGETGWDPCHMAARRMAQRTVATSAE
ncbi:LysR family transcriptional regulator [Hypericibacter sp.]|uniref:LysR family transcriptional regulator n=1 Tax=Hypericibacter sp. TaxID=2705401 RepID=UPI003D6C886A